jgi:2,4-dienoyl-CoA reductase (NADPH2)
MAEDIILSPLKIGSRFETKNRIFRSSISGKFDNYDGSGPTQARINWEEKFARGGVGTIITSYVPVALHGRILTNYAMIDRDQATNRSEQSCLGEPRFSYRQPIH